MRRDQLHICKTCKTVHESEEEKQRMPDPSWPEAELHTCKNCGCDTFYLKLRKFFSRENGISFSQVKIKKIIKNKAYAGEFIMKMNRHDQDYFAETTVGGKSIADVIEKTENFLETKLGKREFTIVS